MSGLFGSITIKGNRLTEFATQTASVGIPIPFGYGHFPCEGNIGFAPMPPKEHVTKKKQGKGGVKSEEYTYTLSYAIMFCEGPIYGYLTIKRNGKVVWTQDPNASVEDAAYAAKWAQKATFYYGTETQLPDSTIEAYKGAGNVSAFRGIAYIVVEDDDVTDNGGAVPTYEAVIMATPPEAYLTSHPYTQLFEDKARVDASLVGGELRTILKETELPEDQASVNAALVGGYLGIRLLTQRSSEQINYGVELLSGNLKSPLVLTESEESCVYTPSLTGGELREALVTYNSPSEFCSYIPSLIGGTLA